VAFITGAARGQGRAEALRLAAKGAEIVAFDICAPIPGRDRVPAATRDDLAETERCVMEMGRRALAVVGDTRDFTDLKGAVDAARTKFGGIDVVIANAGTIGGNALAHEISENDWQTTLGINLLGVWHNVKAALPGMIAAGRGGSIILISSAARIKPTAHLADYGASKAAVIRLTRVLALENGVHNIRGQLHRAGHRRHSNGFERRSIPAVPARPRISDESRCRADIIRPGSAEIESTSGSGRHRERCVVARVRRGRIRDRGDVARRHGGRLALTTLALRRHRLSTAGFKVMHLPPSPRALHLPHRREFNRDD
jgi:NAD(P)-dependent dehydrogenase (short-subunit alcohol dehydrogenase family)